MTDLSILLDLGSLVMLSADDIRRAHGEHHADCQADDCAVTELTGHLLAVADSYRQMVEQLQAKLANTTALTVTEAARRTAASAEEWLKGRSS